MFNNQFKAVAILVGVLIVEHFILTRIYGKRSSLQRIFLDRNFTTKADAVYLAFYVFAFAFKLVRRLAGFLVLPGCAYIVVGVLRNRFSIQPIFGHWSPENEILATAVWLVLLDAPGYLTHIAMHKIPFLWRFHKLHHAATEMNIITGNRLSLGEHFLNDFSRLILLSFVIGLPNREIAGIVLLIRGIVDKLQHSDLPWDYGVLGYVVASPRFHRIHHSSHTADSDANFGNIFSFWDYLFGTVSQRYRHSKDVADTCPLGLSSTEEAEACHQWVTVLFGETLIGYFIDARSRWNAKCSSQNQTSNAAGVQQTGRGRSSLFTLLENLGLKQPRHDKTV